MMRLNLLNFCCLSLRIGSRTISQSTLVQYCDHGGTVTTGIELRTPGIEDPGPGEKHQR